MKIDIIEDHSPYYIKFSHENIDKIVLICQKELKKILRTNSFQHCPLPVDLGVEILNLIPFSNKLKFLKNRVSLFISPGGYTHYVHIDWMAPISLNYSIDIPNDKCTTNLYDTKDIENNFKIDSNLPSDLAKLSIEEFNKNKKLPIKSFVHKQNEVILLNTSMYHDFDNSNSEEDRIILTLRLNKPQCFDDYETIKKIIFEH